MENNFLVSVRCISYNHAPYIKDCMNGFTMQETNFPYVCVIDDDASTDGEPEVINNYLAENFNLDDEDVVRKEETDDYHMIFAQHKTNKNCFFAVYFLNYNHYSIRKSRDKYVEKYIDGAKYIALCEGDDYWIAPDKLQKQVEYMEYHPECTMTFHNAIKYYLQENKIALFNNLREDHTLTAHEAIADWLVPTASIVIRSEYYVYPERLVRIYSADYALILRCFYGGEVYGFSEMMSVYRINTVGTSASAYIKGKFGFVESQHKILLESFNQWSNYKYKDEVDDRISYLNKEIKFQNQRMNKSIAIILNPLFYKKIFGRIHRKFN